MLTFESSKSCLRLYAIFALGILCSYTKVVYAVENVEHQECHMLASTLTVHDFRKCFRILEGKRVSVIGVIKPLYNNGEVVNIDLVPDKDFADFPQSFLQRFSVLMIGEFDDDGASRITENCFGNFAVVSGTAGMFSGMPAIKDPAIIVGFKGGESISCIEAPRSER